VTYCPNNRCLFLLLSPSAICPLVASRYYQRYAWNNIWASNYEPTFTCPMERKIGSRGDGGKWTCDPHRIPRKHIKLMMNVFYAFLDVQNAFVLFVEKTCLVYSFGSNEQFDYEQAILDLLGCEIHTFDPTCAGINAPKGQYRR
jgi:hypothetical protein